MGIPPIVRADVAIWRFPLLTNVGLSTTASLYAYPNAVDLWRGGRELETGGKRDRLSCLGQRQAKVAQIRFLGEILISPKTGLSSIEDFHRGCENPRFFAAGRPGHVGSRTSDQPNFTTGKNF